MKKESENELPKIRVVLRNEFVNLQGEARLNYCVRFRGKTIKKPSGLYINPKYWNSKKMDVLGTTREVQRIRAILDEKIADFNSYFLKIDASGGKITKGTIDDFFDNKEYNDFIDFYLSYVKQHTEYGKSTVSKYKRTLEVLQVFCKDRGLKTLRFNDINLPFLIDFDRYLIYKLKISIDSVRTNGHTISRLSAHLVWATKCRYSVLEGDIKIRCRTLLIQICEAEDIQILKGVVSKDHVHMHIEYRPSQDISTIVKKLKGRTSRKIQMEFPELKKKYWGRHF